MARLGFDHTHRLVPVLVRVLAVAAVLLVPLRAVEQGFFPGDDALSHSAKVASGKDWDQVLIRGPEMVMDGHPGWHALLGLGRRLTGAGAPGLVLLSVFLGFALVWLPPALALRRPEAWLAAGTVLALTDPGIVGRFLMGRPLLVTVTFGVVAGLLSDRLAAPKLPWLPLSAVTAAAALCTWAHGGWYQLAIPLLAFVLAGDLRRAGRVAVATAAGVFLGACLTGQPIAFLVMTVAHLRLVLGGQTLSRQLLVGELQPALIAPAFALAFAAFLLWRRFRESQRPLRGPVFVLALLGAVLGPLGTRFWTDWGLPAAVLWMASEVQEHLERSMPPDSLRRGLTAALLAVPFVLFLASDVGARWTGAPGPSFATAADPEAREWLPEPGGVFYTPEMRLYFRAFFNNPHADWRYVLGFEPATMRADDLAVLRAFLLRPGDVTTLAPWAARMDSRDRLIVTHRSPDPPRGLALEWHPVGYDVWSGRKPR